MTDGASYYILLRLDAIDRRLKCLEDKMAQIDDLNTAIANLATDIKALIAAQPKPVDLTATIAAVNSTDAEVKAAIPPTP